MNLNRDVLHDLFQQHQANFIPFGPPQADDPPQLVETFGEYESEYAALRKSVGFMARPETGLVQVTGSEAADFLQRMLSNDIKSLEPGQAIRAFWLGRDGRIRADLLTLRLADRFLLVTDLFSAVRLTEELNEFVFADDVQITNVSESYYRLALYGPAAADLLAASTGTSFDEPAALTHQQIEIDGRQCLACRFDDAGVLGLHLLVDRDHVIKVYECLTQVVGGICPEVEGGVKRDIPGRAIGWAACNTVRIESGRALYQVDFASGSLPAEAGETVLNETVSFTKGCFPGQEIVARMQSRKQVKKIIAGLKFENDLLPMAGNEVFLPGESGNPQQVIGAITSSTVSPLLGDKAIALAVMASEHSDVSTEVVAGAEGRIVKATVVKLPFV